MPISPEKNTPVGSINTVGKMGFPALFFIDDDNENINGEAWPNLKRHQWNRRIERRIKPTETKEDDPTYQWRAVETMTLYGEFTKSSLTPENPHFYSKAWEADPDAPGTDPGLMQLTFVRGVKYIVGSRDHVGVKTDGKQVTHDISTQGVLGWDIDEINIDDDEISNMAVLTLSLYRIANSWQDEEL